MDAPNNTFSDLVGIVKLWIPRRSESTNALRDFWMPDHSCRVCYECDSQFTVFNRRHHCRICGRVFCAKCTANSVPAQSSDSNIPQEEGEKIRVCNYCFKQWEQGVACVSNGTPPVIIDINTTPSEASFTSTNSSGTIDSAKSMPYAAEPYQRVSYNSAQLSHQSTIAEKNIRKQGTLPSGRNKDLAVDMGDPSPNHYGFCINRSDDDDDEYGGYQLDSKTGHFAHGLDFYGELEYDMVQNGYESRKVHPDEDNCDTKSMSHSPVQNTFDSQMSEVVQNLEKKDGQNMGNVSETPSTMFAAPSSIYPQEDLNLEPVDFENNGLLWLPPEPEDEEDEREVVLFDDEDDGDAAGEWGYLRTSSSFGSGEFRNKEKSSEEHKKAMKNVVDRHFRALISQLLQVENLPLSEEDASEGWLETITNLSWEAATFLKPDTSTGGGMDPGGYVKVKCVASGHRRDSMVVKGVVCKKNVAHRRMTSKIEKPRILILGGALEYQRVTNLLSSFDTLLQQEMDHLQMAVARIDAHQPDVLLVEKSVSRYAQEYLLAKDISLVLNIKRPLLERIARCTGAQIVPSIDNLSSPKLGYCEMFHVDRFLEEHGTAGQGGKKSLKTLMYFEGCPKPLGCTILLKGANGDELKKVKHVIQYGVFAAYHLALETSFLADEGASLPELPLKSPITVALPDKPTSAVRSISTIPGFTVPTNDKSQGPEHNDEPQRSTSVPSSVSTALMQQMETLSTPVLMNGGHGTQLSQPLSIFSGADVCFPSVENHKEFSLHYASGNRNETEAAYLKSNTSASNNNEGNMGNNLAVSSSETIVEVGLVDSFQNHSIMNANNLGASETSLLLQDEKSGNMEQGSSKEEFPPSPSDHQSILVSLSSRCVWKGTVCERSHLFRIKYYGSFDKPLGRFLRDHLFDQSYRCRSCEMPSEAHVHCYTHRQGTLTISVKNLPEILLPGEREGKIWMWHRCLRCPRTNGFPPATRRVVMSDAAWGLSFGKFLELSFSNHAAASRVASCGHSLHRDCLRFYGFGKMAACFRYASIDVHSVYLPPPKVDFNFEIQPWIQKEIEEVVDRAELLFSEVLNALSQISEKQSGPGSAQPNTINKTAESRRHVVELEGILQKEKIEFEESLRKTLNTEVKQGQPIVDILEVNRLKMQLIFQSYMWDRRLIYAASTDCNSVCDGQSFSIAGDQEKILDINGKATETSMLIDPDKGNSTCDILPLNTSLTEVAGEDGEVDNTKQADVVPQQVEVGPVNAQEKDSANPTIKTIVSDQPQPLETGSIALGALSDGQFPIMTNLSETLDAAWTGENHPDVGIRKYNSLPLSGAAVCGAEGLESGDVSDAQGGLQLPRAPSPALSARNSESLEDSVSWIRMPFFSFYPSINKSFIGSSQKLETLCGYKPVYVSSFRDSELQAGARLLLPVGVNDTVIPVYDDEPTSIISYALVSSDYHLQLPDDGERVKDGWGSTTSLPSLESISFSSMHSSEDTISETFRSLGSTDESILSMSGSRSSLVVDPVTYTKALHARVAFGDDGPTGKVKYTVTCYYAKRFEALRRMCCPSELDFVRSLSRCKKWGAQGGKSNVFFAKTLDDRFIIKQVTKTELESFIKFAPGYFKYLSESIGTRSPTCLAKILGIYQVTSKHFKSGKETRMDVLVMENLLFGRNVVRLYDLKGSARSRYNPDSSGSNKVLLDQNLIEAMPTSPIFVGNKAKRLLERAVWNDTAFLASIDVMDYSLLVGVDEEKHELVLGIIDFMRQYTWDKHLETWVKTSGILGGPKNASPTVISPKQYKKRFRKAMTTYFLMVPDQWSPPTIIPSKSQTDLCEENTKTEPQSGDL